MVDRSVEKLDTLVIHARERPSLKISGLNGPMKIILFAAVMSVSVTAFGQSVSLAPINFQISASHALSKFEDAISHPEDVLRRFRPAGVRVSNKYISRNEITFTATKTVLVVSKSVNVRGVFDSQEVGRGCAASEKGYMLSMHFQGSDRLVTDNVREMRALVCLRENSNSNISGKVRAQIIKGSRYSSTLGPMAINLIRDQVSPLISALTEEIRSMR